MLFVGAALLVPGRARAEDAPVSPSAGAAAPEDERVPVARGAFEEGIQLARQGRWSEALGAFERSGRIWPHPVTTYNVGFCELSLGRYTLAKRDLALALSARAPDGTAALPEDLHQSAEEYSLEAEQSLVHLAIELVPRTARLSVDGRPLEIVQSGGSSRALVGTRERGLAEPVPGGKIAVELDPGAHLFRVQDAGGLPGGVERSFAAGAHETLTLVAPPAAARDRRPSGAPGRTPGAPSPAVLPDVAPSRTPAYVALAIGGAGILTGSVAVAVVLTKRSTLPDQCRSHTCPAGAPTDTLDAANRAATVADVGFGVGAAGLLAASYLWWVTRPSSHAGSRAAVEPSIGWKYAGISGKF